MNVNTKANQTTNTDDPSVNVNGTRVESISKGNASPWSTHLLLRYLGDYWALAIVAAEGAAEVGSWKYRGDDKPEELVRGVR
jgi:hypothetical protein